MEKSIEDQLRALAELSVETSAESSPKVAAELRPSEMSGRRDPGPDQRGSRGRWVLVAATLLLVVVLAGTALAIGRDRSSSSGPSSTTTTEAPDPGLLAQMRLLADTAEQAAGVAPTEVTAVVTTAAQADSLIGSSNDCLPGDQVVLYQYGFGQEFTYDGAHGPSWDSAEPAGRALLLSRPGPPGSTPLTGCVSVGVGVLPEPADLSTMGTPVTLYFTPEPGSIQIGLELPSTTLTAGETVQAQIIVNNDGHPFDVLGCISLFGAALSSDATPQGVASLACAQTFVIPAGQSSWSVQVAATYLSCTPAPSDDPTPIPQGAGASVPTCGPGRTMPPLPAGTYTITVGGPDKLPVVDPVQVEVRSSTASTDVTVPDVVGRVVADARAASSRP